MDQATSSSGTSDREWAELFANGHQFDHELLSRFGFDAGLCLEQMRSLAEGRVDASTAAISEIIEPVHDVPEIRYDKSANEMAAYDLGVRALEQGQVAALVLNGGLATRFGGVVKGAVNVFDDLSFLGVKIADVTRAQNLYGAPIPLVVMNSFATCRDTQQHLLSHGYFNMSQENLDCFDQSISVRLTEKGDPFLGTDGSARYYAPGHGEFFQRIHVSGEFAKLLQRGVRYIAFSNIDNLGASLDPLLIGCHIGSGRDMTAEVIRKTRNALGEWDVGGSPVAIGNRVQIVEGFRLPPSLPPDALIDFQTNNMYFSLSALAEPPTVPRYLVTKEIEGRPSIGFEAVTCEATGVLRPNGEPWLSLNMVRVPRRGPRGRFFPVKNREDLATARDEIRARVHEGWALRAQDLKG
jgi:UTP--glucose-1-phosphate uridylyltransferase